MHEDRGFRRKDKRKYAPCACYICTPIGWRKYGGDMRRLLLVCFCVVLLCVAVLWVRSYWVGDVLTWRGGTTSPSHGSSTNVDVDSMMGTFTFGYNSAHESDSLNLIRPAHDVPGFSLAHSSDLSQDQDIHGPAYRFDRWGFIVDWGSHHSSWTRGSDHLTGVVRSFMLGAPYWVVVGLMSGLLLTVAIRHRLRRRLFQPARCQVCGYDLRATPDWCPECGAQPKAASALPSADKRGVRPLPAGPLGV